MAQTMPEADEPLTETQLRRAGASVKYIAYYLAAQAMGASTASTRHAEKVIHRGVNYSGGGFHESLWDDDPRWPNSDNPYGADSTNIAILQNAGIYSLDRNS